MPPGYLIIMINKICSKAGIDNKIVSGRRDYENLLQMMIEIKIINFKKNESVSKLTTEDTE